MSLSGLMSAATAGVSDAVARVKRDAIAYAICGVCAIVAVAMAIWASILALEPEVGAVGARLIVAGAFLIVALAAVLIVRRPVRRAPPASSAAPLGLNAGVSRTQFAQIAMIVEAVMLGYSLSKRGR